jgi:hypothetical protein
MDSIGTAGSKTVLGRLKIPAALTNPFVGTARQPSLQIERLGRAADQPPL